MNISDAVCAVYGKGFGRLAHIWQEFVLIIRGDSPKYLFSPIVRTDLPGNRLAEFIAFPLAFRVYGKYAGKAAAPHK